MTVLTRQPTLTHAWPDRRQRLVLQAALAPDAAARSAWRVLCPKVQPAEEIPAVRRLLPLLGKRLEELEIDDVRVEAMAELRRDAAARNDHLFEHGAELVAALERAGIQTLVLKGAPLAAIAYGDSGLRPMTDLDLLVTPADVDDALRLATELGWRHRNEIPPPWRRIYPDVHLGAADRCQVDLHWRVFHDADGEGRDGPLWASAEPFELAGAATRTLAPAHQLVHVCVHGLRWASTPGIRWVADAALLTRRTAIDWRQVVHEAGRRRFTLRVRMTLGYLRRVLDSPVPDTVLAELAAMPITPMEHLEHAATGRQRSSLSQLAMLWCRFVRTSPSRDPRALATFAADLAWALQLPRVSDLPRALVERGIDRSVRAARSAVSRPARVATPPPVRASIVIPVLRQDLRYLEEAILSAVRQTVPAEVLIVTARDAPAAERAVIEQLRKEAPALPDGSSRVRHIEQCGHGFGAALNTGFRAATAERVGILLSDDLLMPDAVETCLPFDADIISAGIETVAADGVTVLTHISELITQAGYERLETLEARADYLSHFLLLRRAAIARAGWVDETVGDSPGIDDFHLLWSMLETRATVALPGRSVYRYRDHDGERLTLRNPEESAATLARIFERHGVIGDERDTRVDARRRWLGRTIQAAAADGPVPPRGQTTA